MSKIFLVRHAESVGNVNPIEKWVIEYVWQMSTTTETKKKSKCVPLKYKNIK